LIARTIAQLSIVGLISMDPQIFNLTVLASFFILKKKGLPPNLPLGPWKIPILGHTSSSYFYTILKIKRLGQNTWTLDALERYLQL
jgi:hypothetical protein